MMLLLMPMLGHDLEADDGHDGGGECGRDSDEFSVEYCLKAVYVLVAHHFL